MMEPRTMSYLAAACEGGLVGVSPDTLVRSLSTDSRQAAPDCLFVALEGERFDGHAFIPEVLGKQAMVLADRRKVPTGCEGRPMIVVENTRASLGAIAARYRRDFSPRFIAVAGSNGKTTTKELIASVLRESMPTLASEASFNNDVGVPLTLLRLDATHRAAVLEVGTNHPGELAPLVRLIQPDIGVITSIGREHLEFFGDLDGVVEEEGALAELLPAGGTLVVNGDTFGVDRLRRRTRANVILAGAGPANDWRVEKVEVDERGTRFQVVAPEPEWSGEARVPFPGRHQAVNALIALAVGRLCGSTPDAARRGLEKCPQPKMRSQLRRTRGCWLLDDSYNANADSVRAALQTLRDIRTDGRRVAVLGGMAELGRHTAAAHEEVGRLAGELGLDVLVTVGMEAAPSAKAAREAGLGAVHEFAGMEEAIAGLPALLREGDLILLKASRAAGLERLGAALGGSTATA